MPKNVFKLSKIIGGTMDTMNMNHPRPFKKFILVFNCPPVKLAQPSLTLNINSAKEFIWVQLQLTMI